MTPDLREHMSILFVDPSRRDDVLALRSRFEVVEVATVVAAIRSLRLVRPSAIVTELTLPDGDGVAICQDAKQQPDPAATVLVTTATAQHVPAALIAGCDGVLLKPFPPNLLHTRLARLLRDRATRLRQDSCLQNQKLAHLKERFKQVETGTNRTWSDTHCPSCAAGNAVSFDATVHRQMWFACLGCRHVWIAKPHGR